MTSFSSILPSQTTRSQIASLVSKFSHNIFLEAVLITHTGRQDQRLLGMITRWDILEQVRGGALLDELDEEALLEEAS